jgi:hypothetical protein
MNLKESIDFFRHLEEGSASISRERRKLHKKLGVPKNAGWTETGPMSPETAKHKFKLAWERARADVKLGDESPSFYGDTSDMRGKARAALRTRDKPVASGPRGEKAPAGGYSPWTVNRPGQDIETTGEDPMDAKVDQAAFREYLRTKKMPEGYKIVFGKFQRVAPTHQSTRFSKHTKPPKVGVGSDPQHASWRRRSRY